MFNHNLKLFPIWKIIISFRPSPITIQFVVREEQEVTVATVWNSLEELVRVGRNEISRNSCCCACEYVCQQKLVLVVIKFLFNSLQFSISGIIWTKRDCKKIKQNNNKNKIIKKMVVCPHRTSMKLMLLKQSYCVQIGCCSIGYN